MARLPFVTFLQLDAHRIGRSLHKEVPRQAMFPDSPPGWLMLQQRAQRAKTSEELSRIIDEMNELLTEYEAARGGPQSEGIIVGRPGLKHEQRRV
jgi:hypothetical protein